MVWLGWFALGLEFRKRRLCVGPGGSSPEIGGAPAPFALTPPPAQRHGGKIIVAHEFNVEGKFVTRTGVERCCQSWFGLLRESPSVVILEEPSGQIC